MNISCPHCQNRLESAQFADEVLCSACGSSFLLDRAATADWKPSATHRRLGKFELIDQVGMGAFGTVYKARDTELDRIVAIKIPRGGQLGSTSGDTDRFLREARSVAQLRHPSIVAVHDVGQHDGLPYLVADFVAGVTLADLLTSRRLAPRQAAKLIAQVADALEYAHSQGVVHRDVKPSNIMLEEVSGEKTDDHSLLTTHDSPLTSPYSPRLMDFGLAKRDAGEVTMTVEGQVLGTPAYTSPEQARGESHKVDGRSDVYSLGVILYELLAGELPFRGNVRMLLHQVLHDEPRSLRSLNDRIPRDLETISLKAMAKEPAKRYATARDLAGDLRRWLAGEPIQARPVGRAEKSWRWCRRNPVVASLTAAVTTLLLAVAIGATVFAVQFQLIAHQEERRRTEAEDRATAEAKAKAELETTLYFQRIALAHRELLENNLLKAEELLDECVPRVGQPDRRAWEWYYLKRLCHVEPVTIRGQPGSGQALAFSPDGQRLASASQDKTVKIWNATTGEELLTLPDTGQVWCAAFRPPEGRWLATGEATGAVTVWDTTTRLVIRTLVRHTGTIRSVAFSPDGRLLASAGTDKTVKVWDSTTGNLVHDLREHESSVVTVAFSPDGQRLASAGWDMTVKVWDTRTGKPIHTLRGHREPVVGVAFSPDGRRLASASLDRPVKIWDLTTGQETLSLRGHTLEVSGVAFLDDRRVASVGSDKSMLIWDTTTGEVVLTLRGHTHELLGVACSPDGRRLASASGDRTTKIWDATPLDGKAGQETLTLRGHTDQIWDLAFSPDGQRLASASWDATVRVWDARTGREDLTFSNYVRIAFAVAFSPDGQRIASGSAQITKDEPSPLKVWDATTGEEVLQPRSNSLAALGLAFSPGNGRWLVAGTEGSGLNIWNATTGELVHTLKQSPNVWGVSFSPNGRRLASLSREGIVTVYDATRWDDKIPQGPPLTFRALKTSVRGSVAFSPDSQLLVVPGDDNAVNIWDVTATDKPPSAPQQILHGHTAQVLGVAFSRDGRWVASCGEDNTVKLWDAAAGGEPVRSFRGHTGIVRRVAFSPDGKRLASASFDKTVKVWDLTQFEKKPE